MAWMGGGGEVVASLSCSAFFPRSSARNRHGNHLFLSAERSRSCSSGFGSSFGFGFQFLPFMVHPPSWSKSLWTFKVYGNSTPSTLSAHLPPGPHLASHTSTVCWCCSKLYETVRTETPVKTSNSEIQSCMYLEAERDLCSAVTLIQAVSKQTKAAPNFFLPDPSFAKLHFFFLQTHPK